MCINFLIETQLECKNNSSKEQTVVMPECKCRIGIANVQIKIAPR